ncbi:hypothetical protein T07_10710, partial [Trichinella nelsoni]
LVFTNTFCWRLPMKLAMKIAPGQNGLSFVDMDFASFFISNLHHLTGQPIDHIEQEEIFSLPPASKQQERCCRSTNERTDGRQLISIHYSRPTNPPINQQSKKYCLKILKYNTKKKTNETVGISLKIA